MKDVRRVQVAAAMAGLLVAGGMAVAQGRGGPRGPMPGGALKAGSSGVYLLQGNVLLKFAAGTLEAAGSVKVAEAPAPPARGGGQKPPMGPPPAELTLWKDASGAEQVLLVIGGTFVRVDGASMTIKATSALPKPALPDSDALPPPPDDAMGGPGQGGPGGPPPMGHGGGHPMEVVDGILYLPQGPQVLAISVADGKVVGTVTLPKPPAPAG